MDFSQRMGLLPKSKLIQVNEIDMDLRTSLWNVLIETYWCQYTSTNRLYDYLKGSNFDRYSWMLYSLHYKKPIDTIDSRWHKFLATIREDFFSCTWDRVYAFIEFTPQHAPEYKPGHTTRADTFIKTCNQILERENSAYRFVAGKITPITSQDEIEEVERAIAISDQYAGVRTHIQTSLGFLTDRQNPDYRNSIKESISAVESLAKKLVGDDKATLGQALKVLEKKHNLHSSLKNAFSALYGYTNDADGIRHSLMDNESQLTKADARFMLICCSAFINFAIDSVED